LISVLFDDSAGIRRFEQRVHVLREFKQVDSSIDVLPIRRSGLPLTVSPKKFPLPRQEIRL
jgi:hypothetical protein